MVSSPTPDHSSNGETTSTDASAASQDQIVGQSAALQAVFDLIDRVADTPATVLITGESGTGKELVAREIHRRGSRAQQAFMAVNCTAIPANLLEAELFGYEKGAFTDAKIQKRGLFEMAHEGSVFLDEIGLMPPDLQAKLLTVLETRTFRRVGGMQDIHADMRFMAATNENLEEAVSAGQFREDLYYRLNVFPIRLPPLRERDDDVIEIARHFLVLYGNRYQQESCYFSQGAEHWLRNHDWPGNARELRNVIERAVLLCRGNQIQVADLAMGEAERDLQAQERPPAVETTGLGDIRIALPPWGIALEDVERKLIEEALKVARGNVSRAAQLLHISRDTLRYRIKKYRLDELPISQEAE